MNEDFVRERITALRLKKGVSEYQMSYDLGHVRNVFQYDGAGGRRKRRADIGNDVRLQQIGSMK